MCLLGGHGLHIISYLCTRRYLREVRAEIVWNSESIIQFLDQLSTKGNRPVVSTEVRNAFFNYWSEMAHETLDRPCRSVTKGTNGPPFDLFAGSTPR